MRRFSRTSRLAWGCRRLILLSELDFSTMRKRCCSFQWPLEWERLIWPVVGTFVSDPIFGHGFKLCGVGCGFVWEDMFEAGRSL